MASVAHPDLTAAPGVVLYCRVSTEDQAERQTVQAQLEFLRRWCSLYDTPIVGEYVDDGVSGTLPLADRGHGGRLLTELPETRPTKLVVYRLDRLGRSVRVLLDAHAALEQAGVAIQSATEPFDTASPIGRFVFQLLGSIAELERSTITERMTMGRDRVARTGRWTGGVIPFGYDLDEEGHLVPSTRVVANLGITEAEVVRDIYERIAAGSTMLAECQRLKTLGVRKARRYAGGKIVSESEQWYPGRLSTLLRNPVYKGLHVLKSRHGAVERATPALVSAELWERVQQQLLQNRALASKNARHAYLLRGLITCQNCGMRFSGMTRGTDAGRSYYRCNGQLAHVNPLATHRCAAKLLPAPWLEDIVWQDCRRFILNPGEALTDAQHELEGRVAQASALDEQRVTLQRQIDAKDSERQRILTMFRRAVITGEEAEEQLGAIGRETASLREMAQALESQVALAQATEAHLLQAATLLQRLQDHLEAIEQGDRATQRQVVELLVAGVAIETEGRGQGKQARISIRYHFAEPSAVVIPTNSHTDNCCIPSLTRTLNFSRSVPASA